MIQGYHKGYYDEVNYFMSSFFSHGLEHESNTNIVKYGILTGILSDADDIYSGNYTRLHTVES